MTNIIYPFIYKKEKNNKEMFEQIPLYIEADIPYQKDKPEYNEENEENIIIIEIL